MAGNVAFVKAETVEQQAFDTAELDDPSLGVPLSPCFPGAVGIATRELAAAEEDMDRAEGCSSSVGRKKRAEMWQDSEMDALVSAYKQVHLKLQLAGKHGKHIFKSANEKWTEVRNLLLPMGVDRQPKEIERKWSNLLTAYKQIVEWNKKGHPNYWELEEHLKKEKTKAKELPATFRVQLFESMAEFLGERNARKNSRSLADHTSAVSSAPPTPATASVNHAAVASRPTPSSDFGNVDFPLCLDKFGSQLIGSLETASRRPGVVLVSTGSFNPPTIMHLRMFEVARNRLASEGWNVLAAYMSPVNDAYRKPELALAEHRVRLCQIAVMDSPFIMVDSWEARQASYQRTIKVLDRVNDAINGSGIITDGPVKIMLVCGADVLASFNVDGVWLEDQVKRICEEYGIVCITREGSNISKTIFENDILFRNQKNIIVVEDMAKLNISSTYLRRCFSRGLSVRHLTPDGVIEYVRMNRLYNYTE